MKKIINQYFGGKRIIIFLVIIVIIQMVFSIVRFINHDPYVINPLYRLNPKLSLHMSSEGYTMTYPEVLNVTDYLNGSHGDPDIVTVMSNPLRYNYIEISRRKSPKPSVENVLLWGQEKAKISGESEEISRMEFTINRSTGILREYNVYFSLLYNRRNDRCIDWYTVNENKEYDFSFCVDKKYWDLSKNTFMAMIESITFHPTP